MHRDAVLLGILFLFASCSPFSAAGGGPDSVVDGGENTVEGGGPITTGPDAGMADGRAEGRSPCSAPHTICEDFDGPFPWAGWTYQLASTSPVVADTQIHVSPPASLHVTVQPSPDTNHPSFAHRDLAPAQHIVVSADIAVSRSSPGPDGEIDVLALELVPPEGFGRYFVAIVASSEGTYLLETDVQPPGASSIRRRDVLGPLRADFAAARLDLDLEHGTVTASIDGASPPVALVPANGFGAELKVGAGWANNTTGTFSVNVDNLVVDQ